MAKRARSSKATSDARPHGDEAANRVLRQFRQVFNAVKSHFQQVEARVGLGGAQVWALSVIHGSPQCGISALARAMDIHQSTASNLVKILLERKLVLAQRHPSDRRVVQLSLLAAGRRVLRRSPGPFAGVLPSALAELDVETLTRMEADLGKLLALVKVDRRAGRIPLADL